MLCGSLAEEDGEGVSAAFVSLARTGGKSCCAGAAVTRMADAPSFMPRAMIVENSVACRRLGWSSLPVPIGRVVGMWLDCKRTR